MKKYISLVVVCILAACILPACQPASPAVVATPIAIIQATLPPAQPPAAATVEPAPVSTGTAPAVTAGSTPAVEIRMAHEEGDNPKYTVDIEFPVLVSPDGPAFNDAVKTITDRVVQSFKDGASAYPTIDDPNLTSFNSVHIYTTILQQDSHILSVFLEVSEYYRGMAHPAPSSYVVNYSFDTGKVLNLADLFKPDTDYLKLISDYCITELKTKDFFAFPEGADPKPENYQNWNLTPYGLQITFPPYQVAAYAAGFVRITIPYNVLKPQLNPTGPLMYIIKP